MKLINVASSNSEKASAAWFDAVTGVLKVAFGSIVRGIRLDLIPAGDFESTTDIEKFSIDQGGTVVVCHHEDGKETWLPVDMWEPGGFRPPEAKARGRKRDLAALPVYSRKMIEFRCRAGLTQSQAARVAGIPRRTLQQWEQGRQQPAPDRIRQLLETLAVMPAGTPAHR